MNVVRRAASGIASRSVARLRRATRRARPAHPLQHAGRPVLQRHVEVVRHVGQPRHRLREARRDATGVGVHQPQPGHLRDGLGEAFEQLGQPVALGAILAVGGRVLRDEHQLAHPHGGQRPRLADQPVIGSECMRPLIVGMMQNVHGRSQPSEILR